MRVLHVHSGNIFGGIETLLVTLARYEALCPAMETSFALCYEGRFSEELLQHSTRVSWLCPVRISRLWTVVRARRLLAALLRSEGYDIAICHSSWSLAVFGPVVQAAGIPLVFWLHATNDGRHWLERWARKTSPDLIVCNSEFTADKKPLLYPDVPGEVVYCPVAPPERSYSDSERLQARRDASTAEDAIVIIQIARLEPYKGHLVLLEALGKLVDIPGWVYWQVGEARRPFEVQYLHELKARANRLGIQERVRFLGWQSDALQLLAAADIYCQPNTEAEPFGITFIEALGLSRPVVTTALGGPKEIVDKSCGILVPSGDPEALAESLRSILEDADLRTTFGKAGPLRARELCDPMTQMNKLYRLLATINNDHLAEHRQSVRTL